MNWLLRRNSELDPHDKLLNKQILKPTWTYGKQLCGCAKRINVKIIQAFIIRFCGVLFMHLGLSAMMIFIVILR